MSAKQRQNQAPTDGRGTQSSTPTDQDPVAPLIERSPSAAAAVFGDLDQHKADPQPDDRPAY